MHKNLYFKIIYQKLSQCRHSIKILLTGPVTIASMNYPPQNEKVSKLICDVSFTRSNWCGFQLYQLKIKYLEVRILWQVNLQKSELENFYIPWRCHINKVLFIELYNSVTPILISQGCYKKKKITLGVVCWCFIFKLPSATEEASPLSEVYSQFGSCLRFYL